MERNGLPAVREQADLHFRMGSRSAAARIPRTVSPAFAEALAAVRYAVPHVSWKKGILLYTEAQYTAWVAAGLALPEEARRCLRTMFMLAQMVQVSDAGNLRISPPLAVLAGIRTGGQLSWLEDGSILLTGN